MKEKHLELWRTLEIVFLMEQGLPTSIVSSRVFDLKSSLAYFFFAIHYFSIFSSLFLFSFLSSRDLGNSQRNSTLQIPRVIYR